MGHHQRSRSSTFWHMAIWLPRFCKPWNGLLRFKAILNLLTAFNWRPSLPTWHHFSWVNGLSKTSPPRFCRTLKVQVLRTLMWTGRLSESGFSSRRTFSLLKCISESFSYWLDTSSNSTASGTWQVLTMLKESGERNTPSTGSRDPNRTTYLTWNLNSCNSVSLGHIFLTRYSFTQQWNNNLPSKKLETKRRSRSPAPRNLLYQFSSLFTLSNWVWFTRFWEDLAKEEISLACRKLLEC